MRYRLCILNDFDAPQTNMIAIVRIDRDNSVCEWNYLCQKEYRDHRWREVVYESDLIDVETFGVRPIIEVVCGKHRIRAERVGASRATYRDGVARNWQEPIGWAAIIEPALLPALTAYTAQTEIAHGA